MAYKDEYEVARLYTDGTFEKQLAEQFDGDAVARVLHGAAGAREAEGRRRAPAPKKVRFGPWLLPVLKVLAHGKAPARHAFDPFGRTEERRLERRLVDEYEARVDELLAGLTPDKLAVAVAIANVPALDPRLRPRQAGEPGDRPGPRERAAQPLRPGALSAAGRRRVAGQFRGIPVTSA